MPNHSAHEPHITLHAAGSCPRQSNARKARVPLFGCDPIVGQNVKAPALRYANILVGGGVMKKAVHQEHDQCGVAHLGSLSLEGILGLQRTPYEFNTNMAERIVFPALCFDSIVAIDLDLVSSLSGESDRFGIIRAVREKGIAKDQSAMQLKRMTFDRRRVAEHNSVLRSADVLRSACFAETLIAHAGLNSLQIGDQHWHRYYFQCANLVGLECNRDVEVGYRMEISRGCKSLGTRKLLAQAQSLIEDIEVKWLMYSLSLSNIKASATHPFLDSENRTSHPLVEILIKDVPLPDFRRLSAAVEIVGDESLRRQYANIRRWAMQLADQKLSHSKKCQLVQDELADTTREIAKTRLGTIMGVCKILVSATVGVAEDLVKLRWENLANRPFDITTKAVQLYEDERSKKDRPLYVAWKLKRELA